MVSTTAIRLGCHGKVPGYGDFVEVGVDGTLSSQMVQWLKQGRGIAEDRLGARFKLIYDSSATYELIWMSSNSPLLIARIVPSSDAISRRYPFVVFANVALQRHSLHVAVLDASRSAVSTEISDRLEESRLATTPRSVSEVISRDVPRLNLDEHAALEAYTRFVNEETGENFWRSLFGDGNRSARFTVMRGFVDTLAGSRGPKGSEPRVVVQFPLSAGGSGRVSFEIAYWLDLTARWLKRPLDPAYVMWSLPSENHCPGSLFLFFTSPSPTHWTTLIDPTQENETISCLDQAYGEVPAESDVAPTLCDLLIRPTATLADYLSWAESVA